MSMDMYIPSASAGNWGSAASAATAASSTAATPATAATAATAATSGSSMAGSLLSPFAGVLHSVMAETQGLESKATSAVTGLLSGAGVEVQDAMLASTKADMAFELALQVRNKAVAAYQQMMGLQF